MNSHIACLTAAEKSFEPSQADICITGAGLDLGDFVAEHVRVKSVKRPVRGIQVSGFTVKDFSGFDILVVGAEDTKICDNKLLGSPKYGLLCLWSSSIQSPEIPSSPSATSLDLWSATNISSC